MFFENRVSIVAYYFSMTHGYDLKIPIYDLLDRIGIGLFVFNKGAKDRGLIGVLFTRGNPSVHCGKYTLGIG